VTLILIMEKFQVITVLYYFSEVFNWIVKLYV